MLIKRYKRETGTPKHDMKEINLSLSLPFYIVHAQVTRFEGVTVQVLRFVREGLSASNHALAKIQDKFFSPCQHF